MLLAAGPAGKRLAWVAALLALLICVIQIAGKAYVSDFDGHPDEAAHFVTGLMVRDYLVKGLGQNPVEWGSQYYLHYPKVAFGHWPPAFYGLEAAMWLVVPPSRLSAMILVGLAGWVAAVLFYRLACGFADGAVAAFLAVIMVITPVFQESIEECMTETVTLLLGVLFLGALIRAMEEGFSRRNVIWMCVWCVLGILVKGTGAILLPAPVLAVMFARREIWLRLAIWMTVLFLATVGGFTLLHGSLRNAAGFAGLNFRLPWRIDLAVVLAGWGALLAAVAGGVLGVRRRARAVTAVLVFVASIVISSFFLRSMVAKRHWMLLLPCILLLAGYLIRELRRHPDRRMNVAAALAVAVAILVTFPREFYRQDVLDHGALLARLPLPGRVLISSANDWREGGWIAVQCLREPRPSSYLLRGTKLLASAYWNGSGYHLRMFSGEEILAALDRLGIGGVITDDRVDGDAPLPHHKLLKSALGSSPEWRQCGQEAEVEAWCRTGPVPAPTERLRVTTNSGLTTIFEKP